MRLRAVGGESWRIRPPAFKGVIHGRTIELQSESGLPDGQEVSVEVRPVEGPPRWLERLVVDPSVRPGKLIVKGTRLLAEDLAGLVEEGRSDDELLEQHPELMPEDVAAFVNTPSCPPVCAVPSGDGPRTPMNSTRIWNGLGDSARSVAGRSGSELPAGHGHLFRLLERQRSCEQPVHSIRRPVAHLHGDTGRTVRRGLTSQRFPPPFPILARPAQSRGRPAHR